MANGVELLLSLGINKTQSKQEFTKFLNEVKLPTLKVTFGVAVTESRKNLKEFLTAFTDSNNSKVLATFDVDKRASKANISNYLNSLNATANIAFGVNKAESNKNIKNYLTSLKLSDVTVGVKFAGSFSASKFIGNQKSQLIKIVGVLDKEATQLRINETLSKMKVPNLTVGVDGVALGTQSKVFKDLTKEVEKSQKKVKELEDTIKNLGKTTAGATSGSKQPKPTVANPLGEFVGTKREAIKELKATLGEQKKEFEIFQGSVLTSQEQFVNKLKAKGYKVVSDVNPLTKNIEKVTATFKNSANEIETQVFKPFTQNYRTLSMSADAASKQIHGFVKASQKLNNENFRGVAQEASKVHKELEGMYHKGHISAMQMERLGKAIKKAGSIDELQRISGELEKQAVTAKRLEQREAAINAILRERASAQALLTKAQNLYGRTLNKEKANALQEKINSVPADSGSFDSLKTLKSLSSTRNVLSQIKEDIRGVSAEATQATRGAMGLVNSFKVAMEKFPIWLGASTAIFGTIAVAKDFLSVIIDIDTKMTELKKVMADGTDFDAVFKRATQSAETFGQTISNSMDSYIEFAKQGYKGEELGTLSDSALVASNVGDISSQKAAEYLTSTLIQWKMESSEAMSVIDSWNEVSNNYATTLEKLAQGQGKAGATARAMGLDMHQLNGVIGTVTSATKQSGLEVGNFLKSVLPRIISEPAQDALDSLDVVLTTQDGKFRDIMEVYTEVAVKLKSASDVQKTMVVEGLAGKYHISRMQALLDDLGRADSLYRGMYETSKNSANSAMQENSQYMKSLQARINLARVEVEKLALALGEAFMSEGLITFLKLSNSVVGALSSMASSGAGLGIAMASVAGVIALISTRMQSLAKAIVGVGLKMAYSSKSVSTFGRNTTQAGNDSARSSRSIVGLMESFSGVNRESHQAQRGLRGAASGAQNAGNAANAGAAGARALSTGLRAAALSAGVLGAASLALGFVIEKFLSAKTKQRQALEDMQQEEKLLTEAYSNSKTEVDSLVNSYESLNNIMKHRPLNVEEQQKYVDVQNQLAQLLPQLKLGEDAYGNAILHNSAIVNTKIEQTKELIRLEEELKIAEAKKQAESMSEQYSKNLSDYERQVSEKMSNLHILNRGNSSFGVSDVDVSKYTSQEQAVEALTRRIGELTAVKEKAEQAGKSMLVQDVSVQLARLDSLRSGLIDTGRDLEMTRVKFIQTQTDIFNSTVAANDGISNTVKSTISTFAAIAASSDDTTENIQSVFDTLNQGIEFNDSNFLEGFKSLEAAFKDVEEAKQGVFEGNVNEKVLVEKINQVKKQLLELLKVLNIEPNSETFKQIENHFNGVLAVMQDTKSVGSEAAKTFDQVSNSLMGMEDAIESTNEKMQKNAAQIREITTLEEAQVGMSNKLIEETQTLAHAYLELSNKANLTSAEQRYLNDVTAQLKALYPEVIQLSDVRARSLLNEANQNDVLAEASRYAAEGKLSDEQRMTYASAMGAKARIENIKAELNAYSKLQSIYNSLVRTNNQVDARKAYEYSKVMGRAEAGVLAPSHFMYDESQKLQEIKSLEAQLKSTIGTIGAFNTSIRGMGSGGGGGGGGRSGGGGRTSRPAANKSAAASQKSTQTSIYLTDKYAQAIGELNLKIAEQQNLQGKYMTHTKEYRKHLNSELDLLKKKKKLIEEQTLALEAQIKTGKIAQKGNVSNPTYGQTVTTVEKKQISQKLKGWNGVITSGFGKRTHPTTGEVESDHRGIDVAGRKHTPIDANVSGRVLVAGDAAAAGRHWSYGNMVVIKDDKGLQHIYGHLTKAIVRVGDYIQAGTTLGTMGTTGRSTGDHLHYEINQNGAPINPINYLNRARSGQITVGGQQTVYNSAKTAVEDTQQAIDRAKEQLLGFKSEALNISKEIMELETEIINSFLDEFVYKRQSLQDYLDYEDIKIKTLDSNNVRFNKTLDVQIRLKKQQLQAMRDEKKYVDNLISSGSLNNHMMEEMKERTMQLKGSIIELNLAIQQLNFDKITNSARGFDEKIEEIQYLSERSKLIAGLYDEDSLVSKEEAAIQLQYMKDELELLKEKKKSIEANMKVMALSSESTKDLERQLRDISLQYWRLKGSIQSSTKALEEFDKASKQRKEELYRKVLDAYKAYIQQAKEIKMKALDEEIKAEDDRHQKLMDYYQEEQKAIQKQINLKKQAIQKAENDRTYNKDMDKLSSRRKELEKQIANLAFNQSFEGKAKRKELEKELSELVEEIKEKEHQHSIEKQLESLDEQLENEQEHLSDLEKIENKKHEDLKKRLDKQRQYWDKYFTDMLNDEKEFARLEKLVQEEKFDEIEKMFKGLAEELKATLPDLEDTFDGTWKAVGTQIRENVIAELEKAIELMNEFKNIELDKNSTEREHGTSNTRPKDEYIKGSGKNGEFTDADMKVMLGKLMTEKLAPSATSPHRAKNIRDKAHSLAKEGRQDGSELAANRGFDSILGDMTEADKKALANYLKTNSADSQFITKEYIDYIENYGKELSVGNQMTRGDKQVLMAKFMKDEVRDKTENEGYKKALADTANKLAKTGRENNSKIPANKGYNEAIQDYNPTQIAELASFMRSNSGIISDTPTRDEFLKYVDQLAKSTKPLDTGGMTRNWKDKGVDGKGGRWSILHPNEVVSNPLDSEKMLQTSLTLDRIIKQFSNPTLPKSIKQEEIVEHSSFGDIVFKIDKMNGDKNDLENFSNLLKTKLLREKGKR